MTAERNLCGWQGLLTALGPWTQRVFPLERHCTVWWLWKKGWAHGPRVPKWQYQGQPAEPRWPVFSPDSEDVRIGLQVTVWVNRSHFLKGRALDHVSPLRLSVPQRKTSKSLSLWEPK